MSTELMAMNDEMTVIDELSILMDIPKETIAHIIKRIQHAYRDEQEQQYLEMKKKYKLRDGTRGALN